MLNTAAEIFTGDLCKATLYFSTEEQDGFACLGLLFPWRRMQVVGGILPLLILFSDGAWAQISHRGGVSIPGDVQKPSYCGPGHLALGGLA